MNSDTEILSYILNRRSIDPSQLRCKSGYLPIHLACYFNNYNALKLLLPFYVYSPNDSRSQNKPQALHLLHIMAMRSNRECLDLLFDHLPRYAKFNPRTTKNQLTPLHYACYYSNEEFLKKSLEREGSFDFQAESAASHNCLDFVTRGTITDDLILKIIAKTKIDQSSFLLTIQSDRESSQNIDIERFPYSEKDFEIDAKYSSIFYKRFMN